MERITSETTIRMDWMEASQTQKSSVRCPDAILAHLVTALFFTLGRPCQVEASGDLRHHLWEDLGITTGQLLEKTYTRVKVARYGWAVVPMDEALVLSSVDLTRCTLGWQLEDPQVQPEEGFDFGLAREFWAGFCRGAGATVHVQRLAGFNAHHVLEAAFKSLGFSLQAALQPKQGVQSTKGVL
ncbi:MAG TPA: imidazoleglycerol-phosphate dehydratase [Thermotogota bacterium]|nr:imidazoleglycerol-phosphate dehydratase [Thermotogota bacterium]HRW91529.1 imidazoleglycerol-phosphate dehydratase [Thermotogota bacterium]